MYPRSNVDPELEKLRNEADGPPNLDTLTLAIRKATSKIHAAYLFENIGKATLQKLCLSLSSTATGKIYNGWQEFAAHLGLTAEQIRCIDYDFKGLQDPTYYVLLAYVQYPEATLERIINVLENINRLDVINEIKDHVKDLINHIPKDKETDDDTILRPGNVPRVPLVLSLVAEINNGSERNRKCNCAATSQHNLHENSLNPTISVPSSKRNQKYQAIVMLTFAEDGLETARLLTKKFRSRHEKIGVLLLQEQERYVYSRAEEFIDDCFYQVNYIVPILTHKYLTRINKSEDEHLDRQIRLDIKYLKYIYHLMRYEYLRNQCQNTRVRCIVPDNELSVVHKINLHPIFQAWFRESEIEHFIDNILLQKCNYIVN